MFLKTDAETYATTQISLRNIMPSEKSRNKRTHILLSHLHDMPRKGKFRGTESRLVVLELMGKGRGGRVGEEVI